TGVAFEIVTSDGVVYRVEPFDAFVTLPVRSSVMRDGVRREEAWIAAEDEIVVEGVLERAGRHKLPPALRARRITVNGAAAAHRLPPRTLRRGEVEKVEPAKAVEPPKPAEPPKAAEPPNPVEASKAAEPP